MGGCHKTTLMTCDSSNIQTLVLAPLLSISRGNPGGPLPGPLACSLLFTDRRTLSYTDTHPFMTNCTHMKTHKQTHNPAKDRRTEANRRSRVRKRRSPCSESFAGSKRMLYWGVGGIGCVRDERWKEYGGWGGVRSHGVHPTASYAFLLLSLSLSTSLSLSLSYTHKRTKEPKPC